MDTSLNLTIKCLMDQRQPLLDQLQSECERLGSARSSWAKQEEVALWMKEHKVDRAEREWHFTEEDAAERDQVIASYKTSITRLQAQVKEYDDAIMVVLRKWSA